MATKTARNIKKAAPKKSIIKSTAKELNNFVYQTSEVIVDEAFESGAKWQSVSEKATKGILKLSANQQDVMFKAMESVKSQIIDGRKRISSIYSNN